MKEVKSQNSKAIKLTIERLRQFNDLSNLPDVVVFHSLINIGCETGNRRRSSRLNKMQTQKGNVIRE
jgi:hypothetical protein